MEMLRRVGDDGFERRAHGAFDQMTSPRSCIRSPEDHMDVELRLAITVLSDIALKREHFHLLIDDVLNEVRSVPVKVSQPHVLKSADADDTAPDEIELLGQISERLHHLLAYLQRYHVGPPPLALIQQSVMHSPSSKTSQ